MFYLILAIMLILFYIFAAPKSVKGTINLVASVFVLGAIVILLVLGVLHVVKSPPELWICLLMSVLGIWAMVDLYFLDKTK